MYQSRRKTIKIGFIEFLAAIKSTKALFHDLVEVPKAPLAYLLMQKFSQDHLELFFDAVRSAGGFSNNASAQQFTATYKRLLLKSSIQGGKGGKGGKQQDPTVILNIHGDSYSINDDSVNLTNAVLVRRYDLQERIKLPPDHDYTNVQNFVCPSEYKKAAVSYIAGYVSKMV